MRIYPLRFQHLNFCHQFVPCQTEIGVVQKWVPFGMPRLGPEFQSSVFYLYGTNPKTGERQGPLGSGILIAHGLGSHTYNNPNLWGPLDQHIYAVTARHVVTAGASIIRINTMVPATVDGIPTGLADSRFIEREIHEWHFLDGGDDIAITDITDELSTARYSGQSYDSVHVANAQDIITRDFIKEYGVSLGEEGFMVGLFVPSAGQDFNIPASRFGNLSQLADPRNPLKQGHGIKRESHIFDIRSRPGYSGSPVFLYRTPAFDLTRINQRDSWNLSTHKNVFVKLLGIHSGQFMEGVTIESGGPRRGGSMEIPSSMTIVAPAWAIIDALEIKAIKEQRDMREERLNRIAKSASGKVRPEAVQVEPADANPSHKEDFTSLLNAAATKKPQAG